MSSKRKADQVEDGEGGLANSGRVLQAEKQAKKHITLQHSHADALTASQSSASATPSLSTPARTPDSRGGTAPSSPHTAPLPEDEVHTPPALDDRLLASLTLSPLPPSSPSRPAREARLAAATSASVPSSPASACRGSDTLGKRSRHRASLPPVPPLTAGEAVDGDTAASSIPTPSAASITSTRPSAVREPTSPLRSDAASLAESGAAAASASAACKEPLPSSSVGPLRSCATHALNIDSAIRGMQGIRLSSLSHTAEPLTVDTPTPSSITASPVAPTPLPIAPPSASAVMAPRALPLIRLTLNHAGVRRTNSSESAQGNLKKHKRSILSPSPIHIAHSPEKELAPSAPTPPSSSHRSVDSDDHRAGRDPPTLKGGGREEKEAESRDDTDSQSVSSASSEPVPRASGGRERSDEETSVGSLETALSVSSLHGRSPTSSSAGSTSSSPIRCDVCNKELSSAAQLEDHQQGRRHQHVLLMRHSGGAFACELCQKTFTSAADQERHLHSDKHRAMVEAAAAKGAEFSGSAKASVLVLACEMCGVTFTGLTQQKQHLEGRKHLTVVRERERQCEAKDDGGKERRKRDDGGKGRDDADAEADGLTMSKKRKYGRSSPAVPHQQPHHPYHLQPQQQPSPTPRRILPSASPGSAGGGPGVQGRVPQTIRYITPPPQQVVAAPRRSSSRSVGSVGSEGSGDVEGSRGGYRHPRAHQPPSGEESGDAASYASSVSSYEHSPAPYDHSSASFLSSDAAAAMYRPPFPNGEPPSFSPYEPSAAPMYGGVGPSAPFDVFHGGGPPPPYPLPPMLPMPTAPMFTAFLSSSAAAALHGPVVPQLTPITVMYPTQLLLAAQQYSQHPYPFAFSPLYILPDDSTALQQPAHDSLPQPYSHGPSQQDDAQAERDAAEQTAKIVAESPAHEVGPTGPDAAAQAAGAEVA